MRLQSTEKAAPAARSEQPATRSTNAAAPEATPPTNGDHEPPIASLPEPKGPIDPKSVEAAGQIVQHYGALVEQDRFLPAERLWNNIEAARQFATQLDASSGSRTWRLANSGD